MSQGIDDGATLISFACTSEIFAFTERHRSRTCLASGYDAVLVLKISA
jgi:hypothetical protein